MGKQLINSSWLAIKNSFSSQHISHAYIIEGDPETDGLLFSTRMIQLLFCDISEKSNIPSDIYDDSFFKSKTSRLIEEKKHPDCLWIRPTSKSRTILVGDIEVIMNRMNKTAFNNKWKACVILHSDRIHISAQNKLLKILEEPPLGSMIILVTASVNSLLPTITSRCQKIGLKSSIDDNIPCDIIRLLENFPLKNSVQASIFTEKFKTYVSKMYDQINQDLEGRFSNNEIIQKEEIIAIKSSFQKHRINKVISIFMNWFRDLLVLSSTNDDEFIHYKKNIKLLKRQAEIVNPNDLLNCIIIMEKLSTSLNKTIPSDYLFEDAFRKLVIN